MKSAVQLGEEIPVAKTLRQLEQQRLLNRITVVQQSPDIAAMREQYENPSEFIKKLRLSEASKRMLNSFQSFETLES